MKAKDFLKQLQRLDKLIENKLIEQAQWKSIALGTSAQMNGERVQSSGSQQKMADAVNRYIDIEHEIDGVIDNLIETKKKVIAVIEQLEDTTEYDLIHKMYVQYLTLYEVADLYGKTYSWATSIHGRALNHIQEIINEME